MEILEILKKNELTPAKISKKTGIPASRIYKWYGGIANPKSADLEKLEKLVASLPVANVKNADLEKTIGIMQEEIIRLKAALTVCEPMLDFLFSERVDKAVSIVSGERRQAVTMEVERLFSEWKRK